MSIRRWISRNKSFREKRLHATQENKNLRILKDLRNTSDSIDAIRHAYEDKISDLNKEIKRLEAAKDEVTKSLKNARRESHIKSSENRALIHERQRLQRELDELYQSTSWKVTHFGRKASIFIREISSILKKKGGTDQINAAVVLHLYYHDTWPDISKFIKNIPGNPKLFVTVVRRDARTDRLIMRSFPNAEILVYENRGRDVLPFIDLLNRGALDQYDIVCKIHSKKSSHSEFGEVWRDDVLSKLMGSEGRVRAVSRLFSNNPDVGIIGPEGYLLKGEKYLGVNSDKFLDICKRIGSEERDLDRGFIAGSMFWLRPSAMKPLRDIGLTKEDFEDEMMQVDGTLAHALERVFSVSARSSDMKVISTDTLLPFRP